MVSNTCSPNIQEERQEDPESQASLSYMTPSTKEEIRTSQAPPQTCQEPQACTKALCLGQIDFNSTPGLRQGQDLWGERNRREPEGQHPSGDPCMWNFSSLPCPGLGQITSTTACRGWGQRGLRWLRQGLACRCGGQFCPVSTFSTRKLGQRESWRSSRSPG